MANFEKIEREERGKCLVQEHKDSGQAGTWTSSNPGNCLSCQNASHFHMKQVFFSSKCKIYICIISI